MPLRVKCCETKTGSKKDEFTLDKMIIAGIERIGATKTDLTLTLPASIKTVNSTTLYGNANYSPAPIEYDVRYTVRYNALSAQVQSKWYIKHGTHQSEVVKIENIDKNDEYLRFYCKTKKAL
jgi:hypothetical protein